MDSKLYQAATSGDIGFLERMTGAQESSLVSQLTPKKNTVLHVAAEFKQIEFLKKVCVKSPTLIWQANSKGDTPLHVAARVGCTDIVDFFITSPLVTRNDIESRRDETFKNLLRMGNAVNDTALHCAIPNGYYFVVNSLIIADPELSNFVNSSDESPLYLAAANECWSISELILDHSSPSSSHIGTNGTTPMHATMLYCGSASKGFLKKLVEKRPQMIKEVDNLGWTPLHYAAYFRDVKAVQIFLMRESSVAYHLDQDGESALHIAAFRGCVNVMEELIQCHPDICDLVDKRGRTALHAAILGGQENVVKYVLANAKFVGLINEPDKDGNTPLHLAVLVKNYNIVIKLARDKRVNICGLNKEFRTAFSIYIEHKEGGFKAEMVHCLLKKSADVESVQCWIETSVKKRLKEAPVRENSPATIATEKMDNTESFARKKETALEMNMVTSILIAAVTFAAAFTLPGGYKSEAPDQGMATLQTKAAFKAFITFDAIAFCFSVLAVFLQVDISCLGLRMRVRYIPVTMTFMYIAILGMILAFASGIYVVLENSFGLAIAAYLVPGCLMSGYIVSYIVDPGVDPILFLGFSWLRKKVLNLLLHYEII